MRTLHGRGRLLVACLLLTAVAGCMSDGPQIDLDAAPVTTTEPERETPMVEAVVGQSVTTASGNTVSVLQFVGSAPGATGDSLASAEVEACARADLDQAVAVIPEQFVLQLSDERVLLPLPEGSAEPVLRRSVLEGSDCARGWVSYDVPSDDEPSAVVLAGSSVVRWRIR
jgi:hypothetical protein